MIILSDILVPDEFQACTRGPFIFVRPSSKDDRGLIEHEKIHVRQFWCLPIIHSFLYLLSDKYKLKCEVEAYKAQIGCYATDKTKLFAKYLAEKYNLDISLAEAERLLRS